MNKFDSYMSEIKNHIIHKLHTRFLQSLRIRNRLNLQLIDSQRNISSTKYCVVNLQEIINSRHKEHCTFQKDHNTLVIDLSDRRKDTQHNPKNTKHTTKSSKSALTHLKDKFCHMCNKPFACKQNLQSHIEEVHNIGRKNFICDINNCNKVFARKFTLKRHKRVHDKNTK